MQCLCIVRQIKKKKKNNELCYTIILFFISLYNCEDDVSFVLDKPETA